MSWSLSIPWPLERIIRQYVGFNALVSREYGDLIGCYENNDNSRGWLYEKRSGSNAIIAQWRCEDHSFKEYIYHFRFLFDKNWNCVVQHSKENIVRPPKSNK